MIASQSVTVEENRVLLCSANTATLNDPITVIVCPDDTETIYLGGEDVSTTDSIPFGPTDKPMTFILGPGDDLWAIGTATPAEIRVTRMRAQSSSDF